METNETALAGGNTPNEHLSLILCRNSQGAEVRGTLHRLTRYTTVFEVYNPYSVLQLSEVLTDFRITINDRLVYSGRAVITSLVNTGIMLVLEASLSEDCWLDIDLFSPLHHGERLREEFGNFLAETEKIFRVKADFKVVVADMQTMLTDLRRWMEQVELGVRSLAVGDREAAEMEAFAILEQPLMPTVTPLMLQFEKTAGEIEPEDQPAHRSYIKRQIHPLILCSPFTYRTFQKPLGYAGDYEMVSMMLRNPYEGSTMFAKILNRIFLETAPVVAHRNRIGYLIERLREESERVTATGRKVRMFNLGCGPAQEVQQFLVDEPISDEADFTLVDFNDETLFHVTQVLEDKRALHGRQTQVQFVKRSVHQILRDSTRAGAGFQVGGYDVVYCAGLFDYLSDRICRRLLEVFYDLLAPGGLLIATNVDSSNPSRNWMEYVLEWHLVYRDSEQFLKLAPAKAPRETCVVKSDATGVNIFLEVRKPGHA
jgi:extracellular factor (EF) 3-hydroxypalmitic acid methyl ester biosynthesis protein